MLHYYISGQTFVQYLEGCNYISGQLSHFWLLLVASSQSSSISLTNDRPGDNQKVEPGKDVSLSWSFSYDNSEVISQGPWNAQDVQEIIFGTWKPIADGMFMDKKIVAVYSNGTFKARDGYGKDELDWSSSKYKLTFTIKSFTLQDQAIYGINVEFGSAQKSLTDTVYVKTGATYTGQDKNTTVRNGKGRTIRNNWRGGGGGLFPKKILAMQRSYREKKWYSNNPRTSQ